MGRRITLKKTQAGTPSDAAVMEEAAYAYGAGLELAA
jgi:hypothetical protein